MAGRAGSAGIGTAGNFAGSGMSGAFGNGGAAGDDTADADAAVADEPPPPPPMCPADAMAIEGTGRGLKGEYFVGKISRT